MVARDGLFARLARYFPEHEIFVRSGGQMRFIKISTRLQMQLAALAACAVAIWLAVTVLMLGLQIETLRERSAVDAEKQALTHNAGRVAAYRQSIDGMAARVERRQTELDALVERYFGNLPAAPAPLIGAAIPEAAPLARAEQRQIAFAETLTMAAAMRTAEAERAIRRFGLNPDALAGSRGGVGGPFIAAPGDAGFKRLAASLRRLDRVEQALIAIPNAQPTSPMALSSGFGFRWDPLNGAAAMHAGIDVTGAHGQTIRAAAPGRVVEAGLANGYGYLLKIDHGQGLETRYGHLSGFAVKPGDVVTRGQPIARMGNTGRSTGTHLHFEVRMHGRAIDPRPFLGGKSDVSEVQARVERRLADRR